MTGDKVKCFINPSFWKYSEILIQAGNRSLQDHLPPLSAGKWDGNPAVSAGRCRCGSGKKKNITQRGKQKGLLILWLLQKGRPQKWLLAKVITVFRIFLDLNEAYWIWLREVSSYRTVHFIPSIFTWAEVTQQLQFSFNPASTWIHPQKIWCLELEVPCISSHQRLGGQAMNSLAKPVRNEACKTPVISGNPLEYQIMFMLGS